MKYITISFYWEREREREREREMIFAIIASWVAKKRKIDGLQSQREH